MNYRTYAILLLSLSLSSLSTSAQASLEVTATATTATSVDTTSGPAMITWALKVANTDTGGTGDLVLDQLSIDISTSPTALSGVATSASSAFDLSALSSPGTLTTGDFFSNPSTSQGLYTFLSSSAVTWTVLDGTVKDVFDVVVTIPQGVVGTFSLNLANSGSGSSYGVSGDAVLKSFSNSLPSLGAFTASVVPEPSAFLFGSMLVSLIGGTRMWKRDRSDAVEA